MKLQDIRDGFILAAKTLEQINPKIKCYIVAMIGNQQFLAQDLTKGSDGLLKLPINTDLDQSSNSIKALVCQAKELEKSGKKISKEIKAKRAAFEKALETLEFNVPTFELRFNDINIEAIQEIKKHPLVQAIGKTNMSPASINIVIG